MDRIILRMMVDSDIESEIHCTADVRDTALAMLKRRLALVGENRKSYSGPLDAGLNDAFWVSAFAAGFSASYAGVRHPSEEPEPEWICDFVINAKGELAVQ